MSIKAKTINELVKKLSVNNVDQDYYNYVENALSNSLNDVLRKYLLGNDTINFYMTGDHMLSTNLDNATPLTVFISFKADRNSIISYQKIKDANKKTNKMFVNLQSQILTDEKIANSFFKALSNYFGANTKLYIDDNIIMINIENALKVKIIVGYNFDGSFEYNYLGNYYKEDSLKLIKAFDEKEKKTGNFLNMVRFIKSIELEMFKLGYLKSKALDKLNFIELLIYNVPDNILKDNNFNNAFLKTINFLNNANINNFKLADLNYPMFTKDKSFNARYLINDAKLLINSIIYFYNNFNNLY